MTSMNYINFTFKICLLYNCCENRVLLVFTLHVLVTVISTKLLLIILGTKVLAVEYNSFIHFTFIIIQIYKTALYTENLHSFVGHNIKCLSPFPNCKLQVCIPLAYNLGVVH